MALQDRLEHLQIELEDLIEQAVSDAIRRELRAE